jgi:hypothetical protein
MRGGFLHCYSPPSAHEAPLATHNPPALPKDVSRPEKTRHSRPSHILGWTERLLEEQPTHQALPNCLAALVQLVAGHREADRVSALAVKAGSSEPERALEVLNALFKDRKQRGGYVASSEVVDLALGVLRSSIQGTAERGAYQRACRLLDWLVLEPQNREMLASRGGLALLLQVM